MDGMKLGDLVGQLIGVSEKAAHIAQVIRAEEALFSLLVQEKEAKKKKDRFVQDFKTLADVLVQETIRHDLDCKFPGMKDNVHGEESNEFRNQLGETIIVGVQPTCQETAELLGKVLDGNTKAGRLLAEAVHGDIKHVMPSGAENMDQELSVSQVGIWIDPIDGTGQYIHGVSDGSSNGGVFSEGVQCVTILIGAFDIQTGRPIAGVINQPFCEKSTDGDSKSEKWTTRSLWGASYNGQNFYDIPAGQRSDSSQKKSNSTVVLSTSEDDSVIETLQKTCMVLHAAGAGYKVLCAIDSLVSVYLLTKPSTYKWDTCGPHAILTSVGGGIVDFQKAFECLKNSSPETLRANLSELQLRYTEPDSATLPADQMWANAGGIIAYRDVDQLISILTLLC